MIVFLTPVLCDKRMLCDAKTSLYFVLQRQQQSPGQNVRTNNACVIIDRAAFFTRRERAQMRSGFDKKSIRWSNDDYN